MFKLIAIFPFLNKNSEAPPAAPMECTPMEQCQQQHENSNLQQLRKSSSYFIKKRQKEVEETDATRAGATYRFHSYDIGLTAFAIVLRFIAFCFNINLAFDFYKRGDFDYCLWTIICLGVSLVVTSIIHCYMCYEDGKFEQSFLNTLQTCLWIVLASVFLRYYNSLAYALRCKRAERQGDKEQQIRFYKLAISEESDVAFIKLFECFLESAPQKILQISIVLGQTSKITYFQIITICIYFVSTAWGLAAYHRYVRYSQEDKYNIDVWGHYCQFCWHFSISVSRTLIIAFMASIFPLYTIYGCLILATITGIIIYLKDRPCCPEAAIPNFIFCLLFGVVYLFTYISIRNGPTFYKYIFYYTTCLLENIVCIILFITYASSDLKSKSVLFYSLCSGALVFYAFGIIIMIVYYSRFHPQITARRSQRLINNN